MATTNLNKINAKKLREIVAKSGFRDDYLAEQVGVSLGQLRHILAGRRQTSAAVLKLLTMTLKIDESEILKVS